MRQINIANNNDIAFLCSIDDKKRNISVDLAMILNKSVRWSGAYKDIFNQVLLMCDMVWYSATIVHTDPFGSNIERLKVYTSSLGFVFDGWNIGFRKPQKPLDIFSL